MNPNAFLLEQAQLQSAFIPVDLSTAANDGDWVSMKLYQKCTIIFFKGAGTAGDDPVLTVRQATAIAGTSAKALDFTRVWSKVGTQTSLGTFTLNTQAAANTYTDATSAEGASLFVIEIDASDLDQANGFDCIQFQIPDVGTNAQLGAALYLLWPARYGKSTVASAIVD